MSRTPQIFIASSVEGHDVAYDMQELLEFDAECTVWDQDVFKPSSNALSDLISISKKSDFGIFVFSFEDYTEIKGEGKYTVRDNVLFEFGLFAGTIGVENCFIVMPREIKNHHISTDLLGITTLKYNNTRDDHNLKSALGPAANQIKKQIKKFIPKKQISEHLSQQIENVALNSFYANRDDYSKYRLDASTIDRYISTANNSIIIVGISLSTGIQFDNICDFIKDKLNSNPTFKITISLLNPNQSELYQAICGIFNTEVLDLQNQTRATLKKLCNLKKRLPKQSKERFVIKVHKALPFASAIMLDDDLPTGRIQIETKPYKCGMRDSFAMEFQNNGKKFYENLCLSYHKLIDDGDNAEILY